MPYENTYLFLKVFWFVYHHLMVWLKIFGPYLPFLAKMEEAGVISCLLAGKSQTETFIFGSPLSLIPLSFTFGFFEMISKIIRPYVNEIKKLKIIQKIVNYFSVNPSNFSPGQHRIKEFLLKNHYLFYFLFSAIPIVQHLTVICIAAAKITKSSTIKGYLCIIAGHFVQFYLTIKIIYCLPDLFRAIYGSF